MEIVIGIIIGLVVGAGIVFWLNQKKLENQAQELESQKQQLQHQLEASHEKRLQDTIASLQTDYDRQAAQKIEAAKKEQEAAFQKQLEAVQTERDNQLQERDRALEQRITELQNQHQQELQQLQQSHEAQIQATTTVLEQEYEAKRRAQAEATASPVTAPTEAPPVTPLEKVEVVEIGSDRDLSLANVIKSWGKTESVAYIPQLVQQLYSPSDRVREAVAMALGQIAQDKPPRFEIMQTIEYLGSLCHDSSPEVRKAAIASLGKIKSEKVIPLLQQGLRDSNSDVVQTASNAIACYKSYRQTLKPKTLPRNARPLD
jgi:myosin heavy subunit